MRKGATSLVYLEQDGMKLAPFSKSVFLFYSRSRRAVKAILSTNMNLQNAVRAREELSGALKLPSSDLMRSKPGEWIAKYSSAGVSQLARFMSTVRGRMDGIVTRADSPVSSSRIGRGTGS